MRTCAVFYLDLIHCKQPLFAPPMLLIRVAGKSLITELAKSYFT